MSNGNRVNLPNYTNRVAQESDRDKLENYQYKDEPLPRYVASQELVNVVNMAMALGRPLLLEGEPGCGKTTLAKHVAWELDAEYFEWNVKSTGEARHGIYQFDSIQRLSDGQLLDKDPKAKKRFGKPGISYVKWGPLGKAFRLADKPGVVLIDEIDKANTDFPNDLLRELDRAEYSVDELDEQPTQAAQRPLVFVTSNRDKELPPAFLRRCLYHYIDFPEDQLGSIVAAHGIELDYLDQAIARFNGLRTKMRDGTPQADKLPDVAELLDWLRALVHTPADEKTLEKQLPHAYALLKTEQDRRKFS